MSETGLRIASLYCERGDRILLSDLSFDLHAGQGLRIAGANGSGKTTLLRAIVGLSQQYEGAIYWQGQNIRHAKANYWSQLLYLGHAAGIKASLTPLENLVWWLKLQGTGQCVNTEALLAALNSVGLAGFADSPCVYLSAGQQRRVALARLFLSEHKLWVLDEPFTAIDSAGVTLLEQRFEAHLSAGGVILLTTHQNLLSQRFNTYNLDQVAERTNQLT